MSGLNPTHLYRPRHGMLFLCLDNDPAVIVLRDHPKLRETVEVQGRNGYKDWVRKSDLYELKESPRD